MLSIRRRPFAVVAAVTAAALGILAPADAVEESLTKTWETTMPGTLDASEFPVTVVAAPAPVNAGDGVYVFATATKPTLVGGAGLRDHDVVVSALTPDGVLRYSEVFSEGDGSDIGRDDVLVDVEVDGNNNIAYLMIQAGPDALYRKVATRTGKKAGGTRSALDLPGVTVLDIDRTHPGGWLGVAGQAAPNRFYVASIVNGTPALEFAETPVPGIANAVDLPDDSTVNHTMVATGERFGFDLQGAHTVGYTYRPDGAAAQRWSRTFHDPDSRVEQGVAVDLDDVPGLGRRAFVAAETFTPATGFDTLVFAYDDADGSDAWAAPVRIAGPVGGDDRPVAIEHHDGVVYVTGTIDLGGTDDDEVLVVALDASTGAELARVTVGGTIANGDDAPTDLHVTDDRVLVTAEVHQLGGGRRVGLLAFDRLLRPAGVSLLGSGPAGGGGDRIAGVDVTLDGGVVFAGARTFPMAGFDVVVARIEAVDLVVIPRPTALTVEALGAATALDPLDLQVTLVDDDGRPVRDVDVVIDTAGVGTDATATVRTDADGRATARVTPTRSGTIDVQTTFAGSDGLEPSGTTASVDVARRGTTLVVDLVQAGSGKWVRGTLTDQDGSPLPGRLITVSVDGQVVAEGDTDGAGRLFHRPMGVNRSPGTEFVLTFGGDDVRKAATGTKVLTP